MTFNGQTTREWWADEIKKVREQEAAEEKKQAEDKAANMNTFYGQDPESER